MILSHMQIRLSNNPNIFGENGQIFKRFPQYEY